MKTLHKTFSALVLTGIVASMAFVTPALAKGGDPSAKIERIANKLELSEAQTVSFTEIMKAQIEKRKALKEQDLSRPEKREQMQLIKADTFESLQSILSEEQLTQLEEMRGHGKQHRHGKKSKNENTES